MFFICNLILISINKSKFIIFYFSFFLSQISNISVCADFSSDYFYGEKELVATDRFEQIVSKEPNDCIQAQAQGEISYFPHDQLKNREYIKNLLIYSISVFIGLSTYSLLDSLHSKFPIEDWDDSLDEPKQWFTITGFKHFFWSYLWLGVAILFKKINDCV